MRQAQVLPQGIEALAIGALGNRPALASQGKCVFEYPRVAIGAARDEHALRSSLPQHAHGVISAEHVARANHGDGHGTRDLVYDRPICRTRVELLRAPAMHRHRSGARVLEHLGESGRHAIPGVKPDANLRGNGNMRARNRRFHDRRGEQRVIHERRALPLGYDLAGGARHVDIDERELLAHALLDRLHR